MKVDHKGQPIFRRPDSCTGKERMPDDLFFRQLGQQIGEAGGVQAAAEVLLKGLAVIIHLDWVLIVRAGYDHWSLAAVAGHPPDHVLTPFKTGLSYNEGVMGQAIQRNKAIYVPRYNLATSAVHETAEHFSGACAYLPLRGSNGLPWGGILLASEIPREAWELNLRVALERFTEQLSGVLERAVLVGHSLAATAIARLSEENLSPSGVLIRAGQAVAATTQIDSLGLLQIAPGDAPRLLSRWEAHDKSTGAGDELLQGAVHDRWSTNWAPDGPLSAEDAVACFPVTGTSLMIVALRAGQDQRWSLHDRMLLEAVSHAVAFAVEHEQTQSALAQKTAYTRLLLELSQRAFSASTLLGAVEGILLPLLEASGSEFILFAQRQGQDFAVQAAVGTPPSPVPGTEFGLSVPVDYYAFEQFAGKEEPLAHVFVTRTMTGRPGSELFAYPDRLASASVVARGSQQMDGLLILFCEGPRIWTAEDISLLEAVGDTMSGVLQRLHRDEQNRLAAREFEVQAVLSQRLRGLDEPLEIARIGLELSVSLIGCDYATYLDRYEGAKIWSGDVPAAVFDVRKTLEGRPLGGVGGRALRQKEVLWCLDYRTHPDALPAFVDAGLRSAAFTVVLEDDHPIGVLMLAWYAPLTGPVAGADAALRGVADRLGRSFERASHIRQLEATREGALKALGVALEARDFETKGHTERVVTGAVRLGKQLGLSAEDLDALRQGAYLHDIGKLMVPDSVLLKPGVLNENERLEMNRHAQFGAGLAASIPTLPHLARQVVRHHHERWDGTGYPDGLVGEAIPLAARIFSVVDVYDALLSVRPYKPAWSDERARAELLRQAGQQFDPLVVRTFLAENGGEEQLISEVRSALPPSQPTRRSLDKLLERGLEIAALDDPEQVIVRALSLAAELLEVETAVVWLGPDEAGQLELAYAWGQVKDRPAAGSKLSVGSGLIGKTAASGLPQRVNDYQKWSGRLCEYGALGNVLAVPILMTQKVIGVLAVSRSYGDELDTEEQLVLERLVHVIAVALGNARRIAELTFLRAQAETASLIDHLTGVGNRRAMEDAFQSGSLLRRSGQPEKTSPVSVAVLDLVDFKGINDTSGHLQGDRILQQVAGLLSNLFPRVYRLGGDEFALLLDLEFEQATQAVLEGIHQIEHLETGIKDRLKANAGVVQWDHDGESLADSLERADHRMYRAKRAGLPIIR